METNISTPKTELARYIDQLTDEQAVFLTELIQYATFPYGKRALFPLCGITEEQENRIDTAIPVNYARNIEQIYPDFNNGINVYDYNEPCTLGRMVNICNLFTKNVLKNLKID